MVGAVGEYEIEVRRSRFIGAVAPVATRERAEAFIAARRAAEPDARHHCFGYVIGTSERIEKASDDGEPSGTGGAPILEVLRKRDLTDTVAVVTRYFGGVLLGAGGLIRAYGQAAAQTIDRVGVATLHPMALLTVTVAYDRAGRLESELRDAHRVLDVRYDADVDIDVAVPDAEQDAFTAWLADATAGESIAVRTGTDYQ